MRGPTSVTSRFSSLAWWDRRDDVFALEPDPRNFDLLRRNIERNGYSNVTAVPVALSRESGRQKFSRSPHNFADHCLGDGLGQREKIEVEVVRLDDLFPGPAKRVNLLKLDIQGAEFAAIDGAREVLRANPDIVLLSEFWPDGMRRFGDDPEKYLETLRALGFSLRWSAGDRGQSFGRSIASRICSSSARASGS